MNRRVPSRLNIGCHTFDALVLVWDQPGAHDWRTLSEAMKCNRTFVRALVSQMRARELITTDYGMKAIRPTPLAMRLVANAQSRCSLQ